MANSNLTSAKRAKNDEFYTQFGDIQKEMEAYLEYDPNTFRGKVVYCNCDDPFESNFFKYFVLNFERLGLKKLITTSYKGSPVAFTQMTISDMGTDDEIVKPAKGRSTKALAYEITTVGDFNDDGEFNSEDIKYLLTHPQNVSKELRGDGKFPPGDFRSQECEELLEKSDIVVTNPPFSLFREYVKQLFDHNKKFAIIGSLNAITYKEIFPLIKDNKMWLGNGFHAGNAYFATPSVREFASGVYDDKTGLVKFRNCHWFTNLDHGRRHQPLRLSPMAENLKYRGGKLRAKNAYEKYDNYDAIEVPFTNAIPSDYNAVMAVPISFLDKYNPDQFEIMGVTQRNDDPYKIKKYTIEDYPNANDLNARGVIIVNEKPKSMYARILVKHKGK